MASALLLGCRLDAAPRRTVLLAGMGALAVAAGGSALAGHWSVVALAQLVGGIGVGVALPTTYALATELAAPGAGARATGRVLTGWSIALVAGVPLATVLGDAVGWRAAFGALAGLCALQVALYMLLPATPAAGDGCAARGAALRAPGVTALLVGVLAFMAAFYGLFAACGTSVFKSIFRWTDSSTGAPHPLLIISAPSACRHGHPAPLREKLTVRGLPGAFTIPNASAQVIISTAHLPGAQIYAVPLG